MVPNDEGELNYKRNFYHIHRGRCKRDANPKGIAKGTKVLLALPKGFITKMVRRSVWGIWGQDSAQSSTQ
jgi:hypothetical protein